MTGTSVADTRQGGRRGRSVGADLAGLVAVVAAVLLAAGAGLTVAAYRHRLSPAGTDGRTTQARSSYAAAIATRSSSRDRLTKRSASLPEPGISTPPAGRPGRCPVPARHGRRPGSTLVGAGAVAAA